MLTLNGRTFARNNAEFTASLFSPGGTCTGFYRRTPKGAYLYNMQRTLVGFLKCGDQFTGMVSAHKCDDGRTRYMYAADSALERMVGFDTLVYSRQQDAVRAALNETQA